ncbi:MAG: class I SAM-dependent methyltransferase [Actinomycetia bacterium]|jgi:SAM-dependent methyltransferase|nr:class I SAM-dependent methyltransferase [Actinomycetes bacterium]
MDEDEAVEENLDSWDELASVHAQGSGAGFYRIEQWLAGETKLAPWEIEEVGSVSGKSLLHLQCHIGTDTLSWSREGARVTGLDYSPSAIMEAERFAGMIGADDARFVVSRVRDAVESLGGEEFDIVYTGRGALCWLPDIDQWASVCGSLVKQGGILYLEESTPMLNAMEPMATEGGSVFGLRYDLFNKEAVTESNEGSYADPDYPMERRTHCWEYRYDTIINALVANGFRIDLLNERSELFFDPFPGRFVESRPNYWTFKEGETRFPLTFTLKATRL